MGAAVPLSRPEQGPVRGAVGLVTSTGGAPALLKIFAALPNDFPLPCLVVAEQLDRSMRSLAALLSARTSLAVHLARDGEVLAAGIWLAPDGFDLELSGRGTVSTPQSHDYGRPGDRLLNALADRYGERACAVVLTGTGDDGALGLARVRDRRGLTVCQDEASAVVASMPRAARPAAQYVASPVDIAALLVRFAGARGCTSGVG